MHNRRYTYRPYFQRRTRYADPRLGGIPRPLYPKSLQASSYDPTYRHPNATFYHKTFSTGIAAQTLHHVSDMQGIQINPMGGDQLLNISQGHNEGQRVGDDIMIHYIKVTGVVRYECVPDSLDPPENPLVHIWLILDKSPNPTENLDTRAIFKNPSGSKDSSCTPVREPSFFDRFEILDDKLIEVAHTRESTIDSSVPTWHFGGVLRPFTLECKPQSLQKTPLITITQGWSLVKNNFTLLACATGAKTQITYNVEAVYSDA